MIKNQELMIEIADIIAAQFGPSTEVVIHDFTGDIDHTIIHIVNGNVSGRTIGDAPTQSFLRYFNIKGHGLEKKRYITHTSDGRIIRSSTANFFDEDGALDSALCINQDVTNLVALETAVKGLSDERYFETTMLTNTDSEIRTTSIHGMMDGIIAEGLAMIGTPTDKMNKEAKIKLLSFLDERGVFLIQKSGQKVCDLLGISKFTLYNYLDEVRGK